LSTFNFNSHNIWYQKTGTGSTPILFLHNGGNDHRIWDYQVKHFSENYEIYLMDLLGYGQSDKPYIKYTLGLYTDILSEFIETIIKKPVIIMGNCIGAAQALNLSAESPELIKTLVLFNIASVNTLHKGIFSFLYGASKNRIVQNFLTKRSKMKMAISIAKRVTFNRLYGTKGEPAESKKEFKKHIHYLYSNDKNLIILYNLLKNFDTFERIDNLSLPENFPPSMVIWGKQNIILPYKNGEDLCDRLQLTQLNVVENCGHMVMREDYKNVNSSIENFLNY